MALADDRGTRPARSETITLAVDLDGTLLRTDVLYESLATLLKRPWVLVPLAWHLLRGKAAFKAELARRVEVDVERLPANAVLLEWLRRERDDGRLLALYSAADDSVVRRVAQRFGIFDHAQGSDGKVNLAGARKHAAIVARYGPAFAYAGDSRRDLPIWDGCRTAVLVGDVERLRRQLPNSVVIERTFPAPAGRARCWMRALRLHQWVKNLLVFVPLLLSGYRAPDPLVASLLAFIVLSLMASATYIVNDLTDLAADRMHPVKRERPFASGALPIRSGLFAIPILLGLAALPLAWLPARFVAVAVVYLVCTLAYSLRLKKAPILDLILIAFMFTLRIVAGMVAIDAAVSPWLLTFSMFFFFSVAAIKRYDEVRLMASRNDAEVAGRGYRALDGPFLMALGLTTAVSSTLVFFIYLVDPASPSREYARPQLMWIICIVLAYWLGRAWLLASRGAMHIDPVLFALRDRVSLFLGAVTLIVSVAARW